jgi:hypothetical protein
VGFERRRPGLEVAVQLVDHRLEQPELAPEVMVEGAFGEPGARDHLVDRRAGVAVGEERGPGLRQERGAGGRGHLGVGAARHRP